MLAEKVMQEACPNIQNTVYLADSRGVATSRQH